MAAPVGNEFWKLRSKHGRDTLFESAPLLWEESSSYFQWCVDNPLIEIAYVGKDAVRVEIPKMRAFTIEGLCGYLRCNKKYFNDFDAALRKKTKDQLTQADKDFSEVITCIRETIYTQKFTGAAAGFLNATIISRDLGLVDKSKSEVQIKKVGKDLADESYE